MASGKKSKAQHMIKNTYESFNYSGESDYKSDDSDDFLVPDFMKTLEVPKPRILRRNSSQLETQDVNKHTQRSTKSESFIPSIGSKAYMKLVKECEQSQLYIKVKDVSPKCKDQLKLIYADDESISEIEDIPSSNQKSKKVPASGKGSKL